MNRRSPAVFTVPPGISFLDAIAAGVLAATDGDPQALSRYRILLPTRRAVRALADAFLRHSGGTSLLLPSLTPIGDIDVDELEFSIGEELGFDAVADLPPAISGLRRRLLLSRLIRKLGTTIKGPAATADGSSRLASELARLLDQVQTDRLSFDRLRDLVPEDYAGHWQLTLNFLRIATEHWPTVLAEEAALDPAMRRNRLLEAQAAAWEREPPSDPIIAAGSTGSIPATADLLAVIARLPRGSVVLPGLDRYIDSESWALFEPSHPQYGLAQLLERFGVRREDVATWPVPGLAAANAARESLVAEAMRPAATTDAWRTKETISAAAIRGLRRIDCPTPKEEAGVIALIMREALETPGKTAALVTLDRTLARRVAAELRRWDIEIDDSAGQPLAVTPVGAFLRLTAEMLSEGAAPVSLLAGLKHPLASGRMAPAEFRARVRQLEILVLRGPRPARGFQALEDALRASQPGRNKDIEGSDLAAWLRAIARSARPFVRLLSRRSAGLVELLTAHTAFAETLAASADESGEARLWTGDAGEVAAGFISELHQAAHGFPKMPGREYPRLFDALMAGYVVRPKWGRHPRLGTWGPLEARLQHTDLIILGGLNEGSWPAVPAADPWMSRPMRHGFGLPALERRIGLSAHDFSQAMCASEVVLTRSERVEGTPTVPSRWLLRLETVLRGSGLIDDPAADYTAAGRRWLALQRALDAPSRYIAGTRPEPRPPLAARPRNLSVTDIGTWMRDPYAIYARHVLGLVPLDPLDADPGAADRGSFIHLALDRFIRAHPDELPDDAEGKLLEIGREVFGGSLLRPGVRSFWWPRFERLARWFVQCERDRRSGAQTAATEARGHLSFSTTGGLFTLSAKADRLDILPDGSVEIIDYKTGQLPRHREIEAGIEPQLPLEAAILVSGGFGGIQSRQVGGLAYWRLTGGDPVGEIRPLKLDSPAAARSAFEGLRALVETFDDPGTPYFAQPDPDRALRFNSYAHLARYQEWSISAGGES